MQLTKKHSVECNFHNKTLTCRDRAIYYDEGCWKLVSGWDF